MPTDVIANWIRYLGYMSLLRAGVNEPSDTEQRDFYRLSLGLATTGTILLFLTGGSYVWQGAVSEVLESTLSTNVIQEVLIHSVATFGFILTAPIGVGLIYRSFVERKPYRIVAVMGGMMLTCLAFSRFVPAGEAALTFLLIPVFTGLCPLLPPEAIKGVKRSRKAV